MLEVVGVAELNCKDVEDLTVPLEHMSPHTLNILLNKFVCEVAKQNGECDTPNSLYLLVCGINRHLSETGGEDSLNVLNKADIHINNFRANSDFNNCTINFCSEKK